ncbi:MAG TPA: class I SAM-dependent methyltransferase [Vicinamibacterales bacterium]|jgi:ubiquinone/menaquinone biosynthesis C-methylase UbiE|nr:class I SAM-dependent methyltransferase [Vicinamibacterales bacterium]
MAAACALAVCVGGILPAVAQHTRLFPPEDLAQLEGPDRDAWQRPDQIMDALLIGEGSTVADLGAGGGWFTVRLDQRVRPNGLVYAEDIQPEMIEVIRRRVQREDLKTVRTVLGTPEDPKLPPHAIDAVLIVDVYQEIEQPAKLLRNVAASLKPTGVIGIVEFKKDGGGPGPSMSVRVDPEKVIADARAAGLELRKQESFLRYQYMLIFGARPK